MPRPLNMNNYHDMNKKDKYLVAKNSCVSILCVSSGLEKKKTHKSRPFSLNLGFIDCIYLLNLSQLCIVKDNFILGSFCLECFFENSILVMNINACIVSSVYILVEYTYNMLLFY